MTGVEAASSGRAPRMDPDQRRRAILQVAIEAFGEKPYSMVSTAELATRAGITRPLLNHYFGTKRDLYLAVLRRMVLIAPLTPDLVPTGSTEERARFVVEHLLDLVARGGRAWLATVGAEGVGWDPEVEQVLDQADDRAAVWVMQAMSLDPDDRRRRALIRTFGGMLKAGAREWLLHQTLTRRDLANVLTRALVDIDTGLD